MQLISYLNKLTGESNLDGNTKSTTGNNVKQFVT